MVESFVRFVLGATAGLSSSVSQTCTAGQASSGTPKIIFARACHTEEHRTFGNSYISAMLVSPESRDLPAVSPGSGSLTLPLFFRRPPWPRGSLDVFEGNSQLASLDHHRRYLVVVENAEGNLL
jgi:hypothetical protein